MMAEQTVDNIKVLIVDDSSSARAMMRKIVQSDPELSVLGMAPDAFAAAKLMKDELPDVILLDLEMPQIDGLTFLRKIMKQRPLPVLICSSLTEEGSARSVEAMEAGAVDVIHKPVVRDEESLKEATSLICHAIHAAASSKIAPRRRRAPTVPLEKIVSPKLTADAILPPPVVKSRYLKTDPVVCIGASTGGTEVLREVLCALPADAPPVVIVQHMPKGFTRAFANRINTMADIEVMEAEDGMEVKFGRAIIAAGDRHLALRRNGKGYRVEVIDGPAVSRHRPSADVLFRSAAIEAGPNAMGIIMTGMGDDGAQCLGEVMRAGGPTIAQDEASCTVYGMPREAVRMGHVGKSVSLKRIPASIVAFAQMHLRDGAVR